MRLIYYDFNYIREYFLIFFKNLLTKFHSCIIFVTFSKLI